MHPITADDPLTDEEAVALLARLPTRLEPGLSPAEFDAVESRYGLQFAPEHRTLLTAGLPVGQAWPNWRHGSESSLRDRLAWPVDGTLFDVERNGFWDESWGPRPKEMARAVDVARDCLRQVPVMVPVYGHRYLPSGAVTGHPVLSMHQTDIIIYGADLADYLAAEFQFEFQGEPIHHGSVATVAFWSQFV
ncbi:hypothetical protein [Pseudofrankia inefficax]|uniref:SMI1/KNR4 family protein n=1 Tax=Pseudofrankia inefficax (strain DSM 45817 / CECT 9037 / DDB 130130 / EuI1c) TaxID=298654 RepID=E3J9N0_PSEI1|nr:hypothetical protein [Pseudofrankia inefficax]ADP84533.1 hypothetical protein FraEuI1c_6557 [Pseudofrankia inefficax]